MGTLEWLDRSTWWYTWDDMLIVTIVLLFCRWIRFVHQTLHETYRHEIEVSYTLWNVMESYAKISSILQLPRSKSKNTGQHSLAKRWTRKDGGRWHKLPFSTCYRDVRLSGWHNCPASDDFQLHESIRRQFDDHSRSTSSDTADTLHSRFKSIVRFYSSSDVFTSRQLARRPDDGSSREI